MASSKAAAPIVLHTSHRRYTVRSSQSGEGRKSRKFPVSSSEFLVIAMLAMRRSRVTRILSPFC